VLSRYAAILIALIITLLFSCNSKPTTLKHPQLKDVVDKDVLSYSDSLTALRPSDIAAKSTVYLADMSKKINKFPASLDTPSHALLAFQFGVMLNICGSYDSSVHYTYEALTYFEKHPYFFRQLLNCYSLLGISLNNIGKNTFKANYYATKAASMCLLPGIDTVFKISRRCQCFYIAAETNMLCQQDEQALHFARLAYQLIAPYKDSDATIYIRTATVLAGVYVAIGNYDSAKKYITIANEFNDKCGGNEILLSRINEVKMKYFLETKQYNISLKYLMSLSKIDPDYNFYVESYRINLCTLLHKPVEAAKSLAKAEQLAKERGPNDDEFLIFLRNKAHYLSLYGSRRAAEQSFLEFDSVSQDFYRADRLKMFSSIESEYSLADKQNRLNQLHTANKTAENEIRQKNNLLLIAVLGILLLAVVVMSLLLLSRQRKLRAANQLIESQRDKISLEQRLLRTQMEPHFIFNTLNAMQSMVRKNENEKAIVYLNKFARLLRTSLENSRENYVSVAEEIEALQDYISLQSIRFEDKFNYSLTVYEGYEDDEIKIPPMLLQPFVENAIYHGMKNITYKGIISINIGKTGHNLHCVIMDNGSGIIQDKIANHKSLAINITRERLDIISKETGSPASVEVSGRQDDQSGTTVTLVIPYIL
jgi:hypothetical protein